MLDQIRIHGFVSYSCVSRVPVFCNLVGASCSKKAFTRDRQTIPKWLANSHRLPQHAGRRNEGRATSHRKDFLAKRSCLCSWHTGELMSWVGRCVVGSDGKGIAEVGLCDSERDVQLHPGKTNK